MFRQAAHAVGRIFFGQQDGDISAERFRTGHRTRTEDQHAVEVRRIDEGIIENPSDQTAFVADHAGGEVCVPAEIASQGVPDVELPRMTSADSVQKLDVSLVISYTPPVVSQTDLLDESVTVAQTDDILYAQIWIKNTDDRSLAAVGGYLDLVYTDSVFEAGLWTPGDLFSNMTDYAVLEQSGRVEMVGGVCSPDQRSLGVDSWALLGTVSFMVTGEGVGTIEAGTPTVDGVENESYNLARFDGTLASSEISFGSASVTVAGEGEQLVSPVITTGERGVYVSYGANRHLVQWTAVSNASGYELQYAADGADWTSLTVAEPYSVVSGLHYGSAVTYRVRALGGGSYVDSEWSVAKAFYVCPMDINGDGDISGGDRTLLVHSWLAEEGDDEYRFYADVNGDGDISAADRNFLSINWLLSVEDDPDDLFYPAALAFLEDGDLFVSVLDSYFDSFR